MKGHFITLDNQLIHYYKSGNGKKTLITFHGFGLDGSSFHPITSQLPDYTVYSLDLFYHGKSYWNDNEKALTKSYWHQLLKAFLDKMSIDKFSILCFSLGGKFALATIECMPKNIEKVICMAPDGIQTNMWYSLATYPYIFRNLFKKMIVKPSLFYGLLNFLKRFGLVDKGISKFAASQMNSRKKRRRVYYAWVIFKHLTFDMEKLASIINQHDIKVIMILGHYDKIITKKGMAQLLDQLEDYELEIINSGHNDLIKNVSKQNELLDHF